MFERNTSTCLLLWLKTGPENLLQALAVDTKRRFLSCSNSEKIKHDFFHRKTKPTTTVCSSGKKDVHNPGQRPHAHILRSREGAGATFVCGMPWQEGYQGVANVFFSNEDFGPCLVHVWREEANTRQGCWKGRTKGLADSQCLDSPNILTLLGRKKRHHARKAPRYWDTGTEGVYRAERTSNTQCPLTEGGAAIRGSNSAAASA